MPNYSLKGLFSWEIVNADGSVFDGEPTRNNLILTQGINAIASRSFVENMLYCAVGSANSAPLLSDTGLGNEVNRTGDVDTSVTDACLTSRAGNVYSLTKTFKFPVRTVSTSLGEIGWSWSGSPGNNLFSKALIVKNGVPAQITVSIGQYLRVRYTLQITLGPSTAVAGSANIVGWTAPGQYMTQLIGLRSITSSGALGYYDAGNDCNEPSASAGIFIGTSSAALAAFGSSTDRSGGTNYLGSSSNSYLGNGVMVKLLSYGKGVAASSSLRSMGVGTTAAPQTNSGFVFLFDSAQTKLSDYILPLRFIYSWSS